MKESETYYPVVITTTQDMMMKGVLQRDKLAMDIYLHECTSNFNLTDKALREKSDYSLRAADIFFEQLK